MHRRLRFGHGWCRSEITGQASTATTGSSDICFPGTVHYVEGRHSATRIHPELQKIQVGDRINTGSVGSMQIGSPVTVLEPDGALVIGTWAFTLLPLNGNRTRLLVRERDAGWLRLAPRNSGLLLL